MLVSTLALTTFGASVISGAFSMAGGTILMAIYTLMLPVSTVMVLHGVVQAFSNGFRTYFFWKDVHWPTLPGYLLGSALAMGISLLILVVPQKHHVFILLGCISIFSALVPRLHMLSIHRPYRPLSCGFLVTLCKIFSGVSGPILDLFFLETSLNRYQIMATKSFTQMLGHLLKVGYYGSLLWASDKMDFVLPQWVFVIVIAATFLGSHVGKFVLKFMDDTQFNRITKHLILILGAVFLIQGICETCLVQDLKAKFLP